MNINRIRHDDPVEKLKVIIGLSNNDPKMAHKPKLIRIGNEEKRINPVESEHSRGI